MSPNVVVRRFPAVGIIFLRVNTAKQRLSMCGRFALRLPRAQIRHVPGHDGLDVDEWIDEEQFVPRYNIAPRSQAPVLRRGQGPGGYVLHTMKWGLVPHWSKHEDKTLSTTNARAENLVEGGGMWASIKGKKRCAVLAQGYMFYSLSSCASLTRPSYYEWLTKGKDKFPHFTKPRDGSAHLSTQSLQSPTDNTSGQNTPLWTFSIVTTEANKDFSWLHDRQPVILSTRAALDTWLNTDFPAWTPALTNLVRPYSDSDHPLECYQVPKEVGKVGTESPTFIEPIATRKDGIQAMFSKQAAKSKLSQDSQKRSRSPVDVLDLTASPPASKKTKINKHEDSDIQVIEIPPTPSKIKTKSSASQSKSPSKQSKGKASSSNMKLDSFFRKA
ncbi:hypothetical protein C0989_002106 [Termitomyces sp. Mn162]|nr:hypothetical protein C0989_002106 [Termitomyces sp. Mn162]